MANRVLEFFFQLKRLLPGERCMYCGKEINFHDMLWPFCSEKCMKKLTFTEKFNQRGEK